MVALKYSMVGIFCLWASACLAQSGSVKIENTVAGCFKVVASEIKPGNEPVLLDLSIDTKKGSTACPCTSALMRYSVFQRDERDVSLLMSGNFTILGKEKVVLPLAVQKQLIFPDIPVRVRFLCASL